MDDPKQFEVGATPDGIVDWSSIDWPSTYKAVERLQVRIAKATREGRWGKVRSLQRILVRSLPARRLAVRRVTANKGKRTPGIDGILWNTPRKKMQAVDALRGRGYQPRPLRRIHIPKRDGKRRPLSIPCMLDRAMQALHTLALEPVAEQGADPNSYGFRKARSIQDAHERCHMVLAKGNAATWVLDADIEACFDNISHDWLLDHIPMDKSILKKWLKAGYFEGDLFHTTEQGTPQGGVLSPTLANMTLDGLEARVLAAVPRPKKRDPRSKVHVIRYADDLVVTARSRNILEEIVIPAIAAFLEERGLNLSQEKSKIVHIDQGFDFLGANVRKYNGKLLMRPTKAKIKELTQKSRNALCRNCGTKTEIMIHQLNRILRGWAHQFRHLVASRTFGQLDHSIFRQVWRWARRRHNNKGARWVKDRYFSTIGKNKWVLHARQPRPGGRSRTITLFRMSSLPIRRHIKIRSESRYHDPRYAQYFKERQQRRRRTEYLDKRRWPGHQQRKLPLPARTPEKPGRLKVGLGNA